MNEERVKRDDVKDRGFCHCPYCELPLDFEAPYCQPCNVIFLFCAHCEKPIPRDATICPECGRPVGS